MSLFDEGLADATSTTAAQAGDYTFGQKAGAIAAGAMYSALHSFYNTGAAVGNALGADIEQASTVKSLESLDENWAQYYKDNQNAIDLTGFVAGSLVPGGLAIKGLNMLRAGEGVGAFGRALQFAPKQQARYLDAALKELAAEGGTVFTQINKNKFGVLAWEFADQALQAAVFESAVALTMKQSPLLADDGAWDITKGIFTGALLGGGIGGTISSLGINRAFKNGIQEIDRRSIGYQPLHGFDRLNLTEGDKSWTVIDAVLNLPESVSAKDSILRMAFPLGSGPVTRNVDLTSLLTNVLKTGTNKAMSEFELSVRKIAAGADAGSGGTDALAADALSEMLLTRYTALKAKNAPPSQIREEMGDVLFSLKKVQPATDETALDPGQLFYFRKSITPEQTATIKTIEDWKRLVISGTPLPEGERAYKNAFIYVGSPVQLEKEAIALIGHSGDDGFRTLDEAWKAGYNIAKMQDGALRINQGSGAWKSIAAGETSALTPSRFLNTRTGAITEDTVLTAADRVKRGETLKLERDSVLLPGDKGTTQLYMKRALPTDSATLQLDFVTARHAWASTFLGNGAGRLPEVIDVTDISLMQALLAAPAGVKNAALIRLVDGTTVPATEVESRLLQAKIDGLQTLFTSGVHDIRELAYRFATTEAWISKVVENEFGAVNKSVLELLEGSNKPLDSFLKRENLLAHYQSPYQFTEVYAPLEGLTRREKMQSIMEQAGFNGGQFVTGEIAHAYRVKQAVQATKTAGWSVLGVENASQLVDLSQDIASLANSGGAGATLFGAANANYGDKLQIAMQHSGKLVQGWIATASDDIAGAFSTSASKMLNSPKAAAEVGIVTSILRNENGRFVLGTDPLKPQSFVRREIASGSTPEIRARIESDLKAAGERTHIEVADTDAWDFLVTHQKLNEARVNKENLISASRGMQGKKADTMYAPPVDTNYFQHFAFVRPIEGKMFGTSEVAMVFGRDAAELQKRMALVDRSKYNVITKDAGEAYKKAKGDYDFDQTISERTIDSDLRRVGALSNFFPETRAENIIEDYLRWHKNKESRLIRNSVESIYAQQFEELKQLGSSFLEGATSKFSGTTRTAKSEVLNPYEDYIKTALAISKRSEYTFLHQANEFVDALGTRAYRVLNEVTGKAMKGLLPWEEANAIAGRHGVGNLYDDQVAYFTTNAPRDRNLAKEFISKANTLLANVVLRLDFVQPLMNIVSTPLLLGTELASIRTLIAKDSQLTGALNDLTRIGVPGTGGAASVPSTLKLLGNSFRNFFGADKEALLKRYKDNGDIKDTLSLYHSALEDLALTPDFRKFQDGVEKASGKLTGFLTKPSDFSEQFTRFVSADVMRQITEPLVAANKLTIQEANSYIGTFVNRVQGNYIASQRPIVFQGVLGAAVGLFQTYSFNLLQQLLRHVENKDKRALATMFGMQTGLFGLNGTPMFDAINTHIIGNAAINQGHYDAYSVAPGIFGKEWGDWLLYGTASAFPAFGEKWPSLYTRGDINPRHMTILPTNPLDIPAIDGSIRFVSNLAATGKKLVSGADLSESLLQGLEHNGLSRPLAGIAQLMQGHSTTSKGGVIAAMSDYDLISTAARIAGAKPMDEAVALNNMYRLKVYQVADQDRMAALGETVKTHLIRNQYPGDSEMLGFMDRYARIGGRVENFNASLQTWSKDANVSTVEKMRSAFRTSTGQRLSEIMGGGALPDYRTGPAETEEAGTR